MRMEEKDTPQDGGGIENYYIVTEINIEFSQKSRNKPIIWSDALLSIYTKEIKLVHQDIMLPNSLQHYLEYNSQSMEST